MPVLGGFVHHLRARLRFQASASALAAVVATCETFDAASCSGTSLGAASTVALISDDGGSWASIATDFAAPAGALSALCDFAVQDLGAEPVFDLYLDGLFLGVDELIFADGFESGDTSAWSSTVP